MLGRANIKIVGNTGGGTIWSGITWSGNTSDAFGKYVDDDTICAEPNVTYTGTSLNVSGDIRVTGCGIGHDWISTSDCRLKTDIIPISNALSMVNQLCGVYYHFCNDEKKENRVGLMAQDVEKVIPEIVAHISPNDGDEKYGIINNKLSLKYDKLTAVLIEAIKEQQLQISCLQQETKELKTK